MTVEAAYLTRITGVYIGRDADHCFSLQGAKTIAWVDADPWVLLEVPPSSIVYQQLKPKKFEVKLVCMDMNSFYEAFYNTKVNAANTKYAVDPNTGEKCKIDYFVVTAVDHLNVACQFALTGMRVKTVELNSLQEGEANNWIVTFYCEKIVKQA